MMAVGLGAAIASGQGAAVASADDSTGSSESASDSDRSSPSSKPASDATVHSARGDGSDEGSRPDREAHSDEGTGGDAASWTAREARQVVEARRNDPEAAIESKKPRGVAVETIAIADDQPDTADTADTGPATGTTDLLPEAPNTAYDRRRTFAEIRPVLPDRRSRTALAEDADQQDAPAGDAVTTGSDSDQDVRKSSPPAALASAGAAADEPVASMAAPAVHAEVATAQQVTVTSIVNDILTRVGFPRVTFALPLLHVALPGVVQNWWREVRHRFLGLPATPEVVPPSNPPVDPNPVDPNPVDPTPGASEPVLLWETNFTDIAEAMHAWSTQTGRWGQSAGENQYYTPDFSNVTIDANGHLVIEVRREATPDGAPAPNDYTSARVVTYGKQSVEPPVRIVARLQMPYTQGTLPALWMVGLEPGHEFDWPRQGEIDIVEYPGLRDATGRTKWTGNIHGPSATDNTVDVTLHTVGADLGVDLSAAFHDYGIDWYPDRIIWHVDGAEVGQVTKATYEALGGDWTPFSGAWSHYLILNTAVGNPWTGDPDASSQFPQAMKVDWVRVYSLAGGAG